MEELRRMYLDALRARLEALAEARTALDAARSGVDTDAMTAVRRIAHALRGSGGTYGFPEISRAAAAVEDAPQVMLTRRLDGLMLLIREILDGDAP